MWSLLFTDVRQAVRSAWHQPLFTLVVVATLAVSIGANTAMFGVIHGALLKPLPYQDPDRLVLARRTLPGRLLMNNSAPDYYDYKGQLTGFQSLAASTPSAMRLAISGDGRPERANVMRVSHDLLQTLGIAPVAGRSFTPDDGMAGRPFVAVISQRLAERRFAGAREAVGGVITMNGVGPRGAAVPVTIVGVLPDTFRFLDTADVWVAARRGDRDGPETRRFHNWVLVGRLKPGVSMAAVQRQADVVAGRLQRQYPDTNRVKGLQLDPLQSALLTRQTPRLAVLMGAVGLVLLIACANVAGMLIARGVTRRAELAVRGALGASRGRLVAQLLTESVVLSVFAGVVGVVISIWLRRLLPIAGGLAAPGPATSALEWQVLAFSFLASILTGVACGVAPALRAGSPRLAASLAHGLRTTDSRGGARLRSTLVAAQVALSIVLLVGAGLLVRSLAALMTTDLRFDPRNLLAITIDSPSPDPAARERFQRGLLADITSIPGVAAATLCSQVPILQPGNDPPMYAATRPPVDSSQERTALLRTVTPGFFDTMGMKRLAGRDIEPTDRDGTPLVMVVNDAMAREFFPGENPIGQRVIMAGNASQSYEVVGVVEGARTDAVGREPAATVYVPASQDPLRLVNALVRTTLAPEQLTDIVRRLVAARDRDIPVEPAVRLDDIASESLAPQRVATVTLASFSVLALLLTGLGLYGVLAYHVRQRTHEIGIRMALGAGTRRTMVEVLKGSAAMVVPGLAAGLLASIAATKLIAGMLYGVPATDPVTYVVTTVALLAVAALASGIPATRAVRVDPVVALRSE